MISFTEKLEAQRQARALAPEVAPGVPFTFVVDQLYRRVHLHEGRPCIRYARTRTPGDYTLVPYDYLAHPRCAELRKLIKKGWSGLNRP